MEEFISHEGVIKSISDEVICVSIRQNSACAGCHARSACVGISDKERIVEVSSSNSFFEKGEKVRVKIHKHLGFKAIVYAFVIPLISLFISVFLAFRLTGDEVIVALAALASLALYFFILFLLKGKMKQAFSFELEKIDI